MFLKQINFIRITIYMINIQIKLTCNIYILKYNGICCMGFKILFKFL